MQDTAKSGLVDSSNTRPGNKGGLFYNTRKPTWDGTSQVTG